MNEPQSMQDLADLASAKRQMSVRQMSILAKKQGYTITYTTLSQILAGTYKSVPRDATIRAIAWLAGVSNEAAFMAAGQPVPGPPFAEELPPGVDNLPAKARKAAIDMLRVLVDMNKEVVGNGRDHPTHMNQAGESPAKEYDGPLEVVGIRNRAMRQAQSLVLRHGHGGFLDQETADKLFEDESWMEGAKVVDGDLAHSRLRAKFKLMVGQFLSQIQVMHELHPSRPVGDVLDDLLRDILNGGPEGNPQGIDDSGKSIPKNLPSDSDVHPDADEHGRIPLPANYYELAADGSRNYGAEEDARARERGEETQETEGLGGE